jgi:hypothetical protein
VADSPLNLALFRVVLCGLLLGSRELYLAPEVAALPAALRTPPHTLGAWMGVLPVTPGLTWVAVAVCAGSAALGLVGLWTRPALLVAAVSSFYALGVSQLGGAVWHCHHLVWFCALLSVSPCGDALSIDAFWAARRRPGCGPPARDVAYGLPLRICWVLIGCLFFFPGLWKLRAAGMEWIWSDNLRNQLYWKWLQQGGVLPWPRIDRIAGLCRLLAALVVGLELSFPWLVFFRKARSWAVAAALLFHLGTYHFMGIEFSSLWPCYVVFVDWAALLGGLSFRRSDPGVLPPGRLWPTMAVGALLVVAASSYGAMGKMTAWPFACYPTFQWPAGPTMPALLVEVERADGSRSELPRPWQLGRSAGPRAWALAWSVLGIGLDRQPVQPARLRAYWEYLRVLPAVVPASKGARRIRFYGAALPVAPAQWGAPPRARTLLYELRSDS